MLDSAATQEAAQATPSDIAELVPSRPVVSSPANGWRGVVLQHYRHPPGVINIPPVRDHIVVVNRAGQTLVDERHGGGQRERRWTDSGHMSLTPAGQPVSRTLKGRPDVLLIHLSPDLVRDVARSLYGGDPQNVFLRSRLAVPDPNVGRLGELLLNEAEHPECGTEFVVDMLARSLVVHLLRCHSSVAPSLPRQTASSPSGRLRRTIDHMNDHIGEALPLAGLAQLSGLSQAQFARAFREATGQPPHQYLIGLRIKRAGEMLDETELSVIQVGMHCGFEQPNHFATMFRKLTGMSPREWRARRCVTT